VRIPFASWSQFTCLAAAIVTGSVACSDAPTRPSLASAVGEPSANVLSIGDLRRSTPQTPCTAAVHRQFDFWLGEASVSTGGTFDGVNNVTSELDGCLVA